MNLYISSFNNPHIKRLQLFIKNNLKRKNEGLFIVEGIKEINAAIESNYDFETVFLCKNLCHDKHLIEKLYALSDKITILEISKAVFEGLAYRESTGGIIALAYIKAHKLKDIALSNNPFIIVIEAVEKPGNLGAVLRTADACGADAVIVCDQVVDVYNANVIRSSTGCVFFLPIALAPSAEVIKWLKENHICIYGATPSTNKYYTDIDYKKPFAITMGSEANGLSDIWLKEADENIKIPMLGKTDSLNVSISTSVIAYEAVRQRCNII